MEFKSEAQRATYEKIAPWVKEDFGTFATLSASEPVILIQIGTAVAHVSVNTWGNNEATICTTAYVVTSAELVPDLLKYLLLENGNMRFGAFSIDAYDDIIFEHTIIGSSVDRNELKSSVMSVIMVADQYDDVIKQRWGGQTALDRIRAAT